MLLNRGSVTREQVQGYIRQAEKVLALALPPNIELLATGKLFEFPGLQCCYLGNGHSGGIRERPTVGTGGGDDSPLGTSPTRFKSKGPQSPGRAMAVS